MTKDEKKKLATRILKRNGYTDREIKRILAIAFDGKKGKDVPE